jgi:hypothetical protein
VWARRAAAISSRRRQRLSVSIYVRPPRRQLLRKNLSRKSAVLRLERVEKLPGRSSPPRTRGTPRQEPRNAGFSAVSSVSTVVVSLILQRALTSFEEQIGRTDVRSRSDYSHVHTAIGSRWRRRRYGRLYTRESAQRVCRSLGGGWRLPTDREWWQMGKQYGGVSDDSADKGRAAFTALLTGQVSMQCSVATDLPDGTDG